MTTTPAVCDLAAERQRRRSFELVEVGYTATPCHLDHCNLLHPAGGDHTADGASFKIHASTFEHGALWENLVTGEMRREVYFGDPIDADFPEMTAALLREAADWLDAVGT